MEQPPEEEWCYGDLIAVRVHDFNEKVLGSTIPAAFAPTSEAGNPALCVSWIGEDPLEESVQPEKVPGESPAGDSRGEASIGGSKLPEPSASPVTPGSTMDGCEKPTAPACGVSAAAEPSPASNPPQPDFTPGGAAEGDRTVTFERQSAAGSKAATEATVDPSVLPTSLSAALADSPRSEGSNGEPSGAAQVPAPVAPVARKPRHSDCTPISISQAPKGVLHFQVITTLGTKVAVAEANVQSTLEADASESPHVQHYAVVITANASAESASMVYAVLEFSVVIGTTTIAKVASLAASASYAPMCTPLLVGSTCAFSTNTFYFSSKFLAGKGVYIVTNLLCVESFSDNSVSLEIALPDDLKQMHVLPEKKIILEKRGERAYFTCTWDVFSPYVDTANSKSGDSKRASPGFHVLIREGAENRAPVDIELAGELPPTKAEGVGPYMFFVNHAKITNISCSAGDMTVLDILPISLVTRAGA
ncbi:hypothetical protein LSCM4_01894 [Leishmania orientalis]|uniref:Uncharacterized protein n=1 Tax=Leishmania orientalis TaxID=2249476 RepID=A0A836KN78_9TRYP|nr:hypothetical protein LSCM4_01894 [Leishmania orientalis]